MATVLTLVVVPAFYSLFERSKAWIARFFDRHPWVRVGAYSFVGLILATMTYSIITALIFASKGA